MTELPQLVQNFIKAKPSPKQALQYKALGQVLEQPVTGRKVMWSRYLPQVAAFGSFLPRKGMLFLTERGKKLPRAAGRIYFHFK